MTTLSGKLYKTFIGIEFKGDSIIITCLKNSFSGLNLLSSSTFPLKDDDKTITEISRFITRYIRGDSNVFVSIPGNWAVIKFTEVPLPKGRGKEALMGMMRFEIERHIPYQIEDVFYDFQVVEKIETAYKVIFVAVHKEKIDYVRGFLEKLSLQPQVITLFPFAILNSIEYSGVPLGGWRELLGIAKRSDIWGHKNETYVSLFIDRDSAHFAFLKGGLCMHLGSFVLEADRPLDVIIENISSEMTALMESYREKIDKLILSGTVTSLPDLSSALAAKFGISVQSVNPVSKFLKSGENEELQKLAPSIGSCYSGFGRGRLRINLLPHKADVIIGKAGPLVTKISIPFILFLIVGIFAGELLNDKRLLTKIEGRFIENEPEIKVIERLSADLNASEQQRNFLLDIKEDDILLDVLSELTGAMPAEAWLSDFNYKELRREKNETLKGELIIGGYASSSSALISILENSPYFEKVEFVGPVTRRLDKEGFKIKATIVKPAEIEVLSPPVKKEALRVTWESG